ncbi:MAG: hypothetical protein KDJ65_21015 [Anaerolineae bacterium]|nr:hypothetical protein [Anaerolineae bacterium]
MSQLSSQTSFEYEHDAPDPNRGMWLIVAVIIAVIGAFIFLRSSPSDINGYNELTALLNNGQPKVLEFYSNL